MSGAPIIATNYAEFVAAMRHWRRRLGLPQLAVDRRAGLHLGYTGKLEQPDGVTRDGKRYGKRACHPSFDLWLGGVGVALVVVPLRHTRRARPADPRQLLLPLPEPEQRPPLPVKTRKTKPKGKKRRRKGSRKKSAHAKSCIHTGDKMQAECHPEGEFGQTATI
jgi:hypothetical protein